MRYSIDALREEKQDLLIEEANRAGLKQRLDELEAFLEEQTTEVTEYDEGLVRQLIESGTTQTEVAEKVGVSLAYVNRITKGREQIVNKTFVKMMDELGYDVELTYKKKAAE